MFFKKRRGESPGGIAGGDRRGESPGGIAGKSVSGGPFPFAASNHDKCKCGVHFLYNIVKFTHVSINVGQNFTLQVSPLSESGPLSYLTYCY